jgi:hypothetical protein
MSESGRGGGAVVALVFMLTFGAVGVFASWAIGSTLADGWAVRDWVRVKAEVVKYGSGELQYRYRVGDKDYTGDTLGVGFLQSSEVADDVDARLSAALAEHKPVTVFVDPDRPARSVVDPEIPWKMVLFMLPFALGFGGVGLGAGYVFVRSFFPESEEAKAPTMAAGPGAGAWPLWVFAFFWNALAFPISFIAVPEMMRSGEYLGLLILIFPLVGVLILWGAIRSTWLAIRMGGSDIRLQPFPPRLGEVVSGFVTFRRGVAAGASFKVRLVCTSVGQESIATHWKAEKDARVVQGPQELRLAFGFDTPDRLPPSAGERDEPTHWRLELYRPGEMGSPAYAFAFEVLPPLGAEHESEEEHEAVVEEEEEQLAVAAPMAPAVQNLLKALGGEEKLAAMSPRDRLKFNARMDAMTPEQRAAIEKIGSYAHMMPLAKKALFWAIGLFVLVQVAGVVAVFLFSGP